MEAYRQRLRTKIIVMSCLYELRAIRNLIHGGRNHHDLRLRKIFCL